MSNVGATHPFHVRDTPGGADVSNPAIGNNGSTGTVTISWTPAAAGTYYYQCGTHSSMLGVILVDWKSLILTKCMINMGKILLF